MELWDVYDENRQPTGRFHRRGQPMGPGDYHLVVHIWIRNSAGEYLIQRRQLTKPYLPGMWDCAVAGAAQAGDDSRGAALREIREEIGLDLPPDSLRLLATLDFDRGFDDIWYAELDVDAPSLTLQEEEVMAVRWASGEEIRSLAAQGEFVWFPGYNDIPELP
jgi:isopentenyldiphosphate isomerase